MQNPVKSPPESIHDTATASEEGTGHGRTEETTLLIVDDEPAILSAVGRALRRSGYRLFTAQNALSALELMTREVVDVVVSDMRMPRMDGAELLARVRRNWPQVTRVLITGQSDLSEAIRAVNRGGIHFYISKPWDDDDLRRVMAEAAERAQLHRENARLLALTQSQNARLAALNEELEARVEARTGELQNAYTKLQKRNHSLNDSYRATIRLVASLIDMRPGIEKGFGKDVADLARRIARMGDLSRRDCMNVYFAGLLHELGKVGLPEDLFAPFEDLTVEQREIFQKHPALAQFALDGADFLKECGTIIAAHCEDWDGRGFPNRLSAHSIPVGARVLRVARDYMLAYRSLTRIAPKHRSRHAFTTLQPHIGARYDAEAMHWLEKVLDRERRDTAMEDESCIVVRQLMPGMVLSRDVITSHGVVMLAKDHRLTERNVDHLADLQVVERREINVWVYT